MAVRMRLLRIGRTHSPKYRICVMERSRRRDGAYIESVGYYDPFIRDDRKKVQIKKDRAEYWLSVGALPSDTVRSFLKAANVDGVVKQKPKRKRRRKASSKNAPRAAGTKARKPPKKSRTDQS